MSAKNVMQQTNGNGTQFVKKKLFKGNLVINLMMIDFVICLIFFVPFLQLHFSNDSYTAMVQQADGQAMVHMMNGRFAAVLIMLIVKALGINLVLDTALGVFTLMFCSAWCIAKITEWIFDEKLMEENRLDIAVVHVSCIVGFCNVFIAEWYQFTEVLFVYTASAVCCVYAARLFKENKKVFSFLLLTAGYNFYQSSMAFFVFLILFFVLKKYQFRFHWQAVKETVIAALQCGGVFAANYLLTKGLIILGKLPQDSRYNDIGAKFIIDNIKLLFLNQKILWADADGMMTLPLMAVMIIILIFLSVITFLQKKERKAKDACYVAVMLAGGILVVYFPIILLNYFWIAPRSIVPLFFVYIVFVSYIVFQGKKWMKQTALVCLCVFLAGMMHYTHVYGKDVLYSNKMDKWYIDTVEDRIEEYERQNNIKIEYLGFAPDANVQYRWDLSGKYVWDVAVKAITVSWARVCAFNYLESESYELVEVPEEYVQYFSQNDWNSLDVEAQVKFDGNKCYIAVF